MALPQPGGNPTHLTLSMNKLLIPRTKSTPAVILDPSTGTFLFSGQSIPENPAAFFAPVIEWLDRELGTLPDGSVFRFRLPYFSTSSMKAVYLVVQKIREGMKAAGHTFTIQWVVEDDDDFMSEAAENFSTLLDIPIQIVHLHEDEAEAELARLSKQSELS